MGNGLTVLTRLQHSHTRAYNEFLLDRARVPFVWGSTDCALFAADGILAQTGIDIAAEFRGRYHDQSGAFAAIKEITGGTTVADAAAWCAAKFGMEEWTYPLMARRGDLVTLDDGGNEVAGLVHLNGRDIAVVGDKGLHRLPIASVKRAWRVA
jgi:hypothetical protein